MSVILETRQLCKFYGAGENQVKAVNQVDIQIEQGRICCNCRKVRFR